MTRNPESRGRYEVLAINKAGRALVIDTTDDRDTAISKADNIRGVVRDRQTGRIHATIHGRAAWYSQATVFAARGIIGKTDPDRLPMSPFAAMLMDIAINTLPEARA